jgi:hypothetical protein
VADGPTLLAAAGSDLLDQSPGQIDGEDGFGSWHRQQLGTLRLQEVTIGLPAGDAAATDQSRQDSAGGFVSSQHPYRHIDSPRFRRQRSSGHLAVYLILYVSRGQEFSL